MLRLLLLPLYIFISASDNGEFERVERRYNLANARKGKAAVRDAVNFVLRQQKKIRPVESAESGVKWQSVNTNGTQSCNVSMSALLHNGELVYLGDDVAPSYNHLCWAARIRYHTSPVCESEERARKVKPISNFEWGLKDARKGYCRMPSTVPQHVAREYLTHNNINKRRKMTVLMLGLSFMGQPFQALNCLYADRVTDGEAFHIYWQKGDFKTTLPLKGIRANGGQCTGYKQGEISRYFPPKYHPGRNWTSLPKQNYDLCHMDSFLSIFGAANDRADEAEMQICYQYTFDVMNTVKDGSPLPCGLRWKDIDVILSMPGPGEIFDYFIPRTRGVGHLKRKLKIVFIDNIYQGLLHNQLVEAVKTNGFDYKVHVDDYNAKFANCSMGSSDIHYRLPGIPDLAINMWLSLLSSGLVDNEFKNNTAHGIRYWI